LAQNAADLKPTAPCVSVKLTHQLFMSKLGGASVFSLLRPARGYGVGMKVTRDIWKFPESYWLVTRVELNKAQTSGSAWGVFHWRGKPAGRKPGAERRLRCPLKKQWHRYEDFEALDPHPYGWEKQQ